MRLLWPSLHISVCQQIYITYEKLWMDFCEFCAMGLRCIHFYTSILTGYVVEQTDDTVLISL